MILIIGSYTDSLPHVQAKGTGISLLHIDMETGEISPGATFSAIRNPTYIAVSQDAMRLYAVEEIGETEGASVIVFSLEKEELKLSPVAQVSAHGDCPCHVSLNVPEDRLLISNYVSGTFATYALDAEGLPLPGEMTIQRVGNGPNKLRQERPHVHQGVATPDGLHVLVCDAGTDEIARHKISGALIDPAPNLVIKTDGGSLPRHLVFAPEGKHFLVAHELGCYVESYSYSSDGIEVIDRAATLPDDWKGDSSCAAIRIHPNGRFVYVSNRGHDSIAAFEVSTSGKIIKTLGWYSTGGSVPRDFAIDPNGKLLVAANQDSHSLVTFLIDVDTGALSQLAGPYNVGSPVNVVFC